MNEPLERDAVEAVGGDGQRRPTTSGTSSNERPSHETPSHPTHANLAPRPDDPARAAPGAEGSAEAPRIASAPPPRDKQVAVHPPEERRTAHAGRAASKRGRGRPRKKWVVHVKPIDPTQYPELESNPENPFSSMDADQRMQEIVSFCAQLWARTCDDATRKAKAA